MALLDADPAPQDPSRLVPAPARVEPSSPSSDAPPPQRTGRGLVLAVALGCVLLRLAYAGRTVGRDEAGFLLVGSQWSEGGGSLYGSYWVDRPPLLITLFWLGDQLGGLVALRVLGALGAGLAVLALAGAARTLWGTRAAVPTAVVAAALLSSHLLASLEVNGELLAAPFLAGGTLAAVRAAQRFESASGPDQAGLAWAAVTGVCAVAALLVKQNMADVVVFGLVLGLALVRSGRVVTAQIGPALAAAAAGVLAALVAASVWSLTWGTSPVDVFDAMYPFRLEASRVIAGDEGAGESLERLVRLLGGFAASGLALLEVTATGLALARGRREPVLVALAATLGYGVFSMLAGSVYWLHYLIELVPAASLVAGYVLSRPAEAVGRRLRAGVVLACVLAVLSTGVSLVRAAVVEPRGDQRAVGEALAGAARADDTLVTLYGDSDLNYRAGLPSPYEHLWNLPIKVRDPQLRGLVDVLEGRRAPAWVVSGRSLETWGLETRRTRRLLEQRYRLVARCARYDVHLRVGLDRPAPACESVVG